MALQFKKKCVVQWIMGEERLGGGVYKDVVIGDLDLFRSKGDGKERLRIKLYRNDAEAEVYVGMADPLLRKLAKVCGLKTKLGENVDLGEMIGCRVGVQLEENEVNKRIYTNLKDVWESEVEEDLCKDEEQVHQVEALFEEVEEELDVEVSQPISNKGTSVIKRKNPISPRRREN